MILRDVDRDVMAYVGSQIKHYRKMRSMSILKVAEMADIDPTYLIRIEKGANLSIIILFRIMEVLDIKADCLFPNSMLN